MYQLLKGVVQRETKKLRVETSDPVLVPVAVRWMHGSNISSWQLPALVYSSSPRRGSCPLPPASLSPSSLPPMGCCVSHALSAVLQAPPGPARPGPVRPGPPTLPLSSSERRLCRVPRHLAATSISTLHSVHFLPLALPPSLLNLTYECLFGMFLTSCFGLASSHSALSLPLSLPRQVQGGLPWTALRPVCPQDGRHPVRSKYVSILWGFLFSFSNFHFQMVTFDLQSAKANKPHGRE